jgi:hypothetical protein
MKARELEHLFGEWRQLTEAEGRAIAGDDWTEVQRQQKRKEDLQVRLLCATEAWRNLWPSTGETHADFERQFRPLIAELISLETTNAQLVATRRENAHREFAECDRAAENLRGLNRAYGTSAGGHWSSYS